MGRPEKIDRDVIKQMSTDFKSGSSVLELRARSELLNEELRVLQEQIRETHDPDKRNRRPPGL